MCTDFSPLQYYVTASLRLEHMLKCPFLTIKDVFFIFSNLARITRLAVEEDDSEWLQYVAAILRCLFSTSYPQLKLDEHLGNLPDHRTPDFGLKFGRYCTSQEWKDYVEGVVSCVWVWLYADVLSSMWVWTKRVWGGCRCGQSCTSSWNMGGVIFILLAEDSGGAVQWCADALAAGEGRPQQAVCKGC